MKKALARKVRIAPKKMIKKAPGKTYLVKK